MSTQLAGFFALAILVGTISGIHIPINGAMGAKIQSPLLATVVFYSIALALTAAAFLLFGDYGAVARIPAVPYWYYAAGVLSAISVSSSTFLIPRIGAINLFVIVLTLQMIARMVISHFGWFASPLDAITWPKLLGALFLLAGAVLVVRN